MISIPRLQLHLTERCNLACTYCYLGHPTAPRDMTSEVGQKAICFYLDHLSDDLPEVTISFFGGEPLLKFPLMEELAPFALDECMRRGRKVRFSITCNGTAIRPKIAKFLTDYRFTTLISWDGNPETQDKFRILFDDRGSSHLMDKAIPHIQTLPEVGVRMTWSEATLPQLATNVRYFTDLGIDWLGFAPLDNMIFTDELLQAYRRQLDEIIALWCDHLRRGRMLYFNPLLKMMARVFDTTAPLHFHMHACDPLHGRISVGFDGKLFPCHRFLGRGDMTIGSVFDGGLDERVLQTFAKFNGQGLDGCLAMLDPQVGGEKPRHRDDFIRMMEVTAAGSERMLDQGVEILRQWPPERVPAQARAMMKRHAEWQSARAVA
jgi:uncharacterized protein